MKNHELSYLNSCKKQIETQLNWAPSSVWKQRDFLDLIDLINTKTEICLSLSTLKRIWKNDYSGTPHPTTLDAFAKFLDYENWLDFKNNTQIENHSNAQPASKPKTMRWIYASLAFILVVVSVFVILSNHQPESTSGVFYNPNEVEFTCNTTVAKGVPNTVIFTYNASQVQADSFFIQQSWDRFRRDKINKHNTKLTSTYLYPGYHKAKLIANDSIIKEVGVRVNTNGWLAITRYNYRDMEPTYIKNKDIVANGKLHISQKHLQQYKVETNKQLISSYFFIDNFSGLSSSNFTFETRVKCDSIVNSNCPYISLVITGEGDMNLIPLIKPGCVGEAFMKIGDKMISGKDNDLSALGTNIYDWQLLKLKVVNKQAQVFFNTKLVFETTFNTDIKEITGCNLNFTGSGSVDFVKILDEKNKLVYSEDF